MPVNLKELCTEFQQLETREPFSPTPDIDLVWVLAGPGTILTELNSGQYAGRSPDRERILAGIDIIEEVTALRAGKPKEEVTLADIELKGPTLFYNGEVEGQGAYPQNTDLRQWVNEGNSSIGSKLVIQDLEEIFTPGQVKSLANFLSKNPNIHKIAVVTHAPHGRRVARYMKKDENLFPNITFVDASIPEKGIPLIATLEELWRIVAYAEKGDLAETPLY